MQVYTQCPICTSTDTHLHYPGGAMWFPGTGQFGLVSQDRTGAPYLEQMCVTHNPNTLALLVMSSWEHLLSVN